MKMVVKTSASWSVQTLSTPWNAVRISYLPGVHTSEHSHKFFHAHTVFQVVDDGRVHKVLLSHLKLCKEVVVLFC